MTNYEQYVNELKRRLAHFETSDQYKTGTQPLRVYPPTFLEDIEDMEQEIRQQTGMEEFRVGDPIKRFYLAANGFDFAWQYLDHADQSRITAGTGHVTTVYELYDPVDKRGEPFDLVYQEYRLFDWIGTESHVSLRFHRGRDEPELYYYTKDTGSYHLLILGFADYLDTLLETMGLYPWQEFFVADPTFSMDPYQANRFLEDLELLFPDADIRRYRERVR